MVRPNLRTAGMICLAVIALVLLDMLATAMKIDPPPVPLDPEGHTAPYYDSPLLGIYIAGNIRVEATACKLAHGENRNVTCRLIFRHRICATGTWI
jgi:hypothetical protein